MGQSYRQLELEIVEEFIVQFAPKGHIERDVVVGRKYLSKEIKELAQKHGNVEKVLLKRIDLLTRGECITIYEAKQRMCSKALGQLLIYQRLLSEEMDLPPDMIKLGLICQYIDPMIAHIFREYGIAVYAVERKI